MVNIRVIHTVTTTNVPVLISGYEKGSGHYPTPFITHTLITHIMKNRVRYFEPFDSNLSHN